MIRILDNALYIYITAVVRSVFRYYNKIINDNIKTTSQHYRVPMRKTVHITNVQCAI